MTASARTGRPLVVLNVNDDPHAELDPAQYAKFLEIENANALETVQRMLHEHGGRSADLFLIDIDMSKANSPEGLEWGHRTFRAYGPLLALPFIGRGAAAFVPYSGYWGNPAVTNNGFVRVALSMLLTRIFDKPHSLDDVGDFIRTSLGDKLPDRAGGSLVQEAGVAIRQALDQYRRHLDEDQRIQFVDIDVTYRRLQELENQAFLQADGWPLRVPFADSEGTLFVDVRYGSRGRDCIQLSSLFADVLSFRPPATQDALTPIYDYLKRWERRSVTARGDTLYEYVTKLLDMCRDGMPILRAIASTGQAADAFNRHQVIRLAMALAWVEAWHRERGPNRQRRTALVHELLGLRARKNERGMNGKGVKQKTRLSIKKAVTQKKASDDESPVFPTTTYKRLLGKEIGNKIYVSDEPFRIPLRKAFGNVAEAYGLNDYDDAGQLTHQEKQECIRYAVDELGWDPSTVDADSTHPYPRWLRDG